MLPRCTALRVTVALTVALAASVHPAGAAETPVAETNYAIVLRTINPHLQVHESLAYARSLLADCERANLDPNLILALVTVESSWRQTAVSSRGARGLGQLMPTTAARLGVNPRDPAQNLRGAIGAYNAGPLAVEKYRGIPPYYETRHYVTKVLAQWHRLSARVAKTFV